MFAFMAKSQVYLDENFDYAAASLLKNNTGWGVNTGTLNSWDTEFYIGATSLSYSQGVNNFVNSDLGKSVVCDYPTYATPLVNSSNYCISKNFVSSALATGTVYASFLYSPNSIAQIQSQIPVISLGTSGSNTGVQVWVGKVATDGSTFRIGVTRGSTSSGSIQWGSTAFTDISTTYLIVLKYDITATSASVFINPILGSTSDGIALATDAASSSPKTSLQVVQFKVNAASKEYFKVSGLRISSTWEEAVATAAPALAQLSAPVMGSATAVTGVGFTANWSTVTNAVGYDVKVYQGTTLINSYPVLGQATSSLVIENLAGGTTYTYTVIAKGNGTANSDSDPSTASADVMTTTVTQLTTPLIRPASSITLTGFTANWVVVENATDYDVEVYMGASFVKTVNAVGQTTSSVLITGLNNFTEYSYRVIAKAAGIIYGNSDSSSSAFVVTLDPNAVASIDTDFGDGTWGASDATARAFGSFLSSSVNGFELEKAYLLSGDENDLKGMSHTNRIHVDKSSNGGMVVLPAVNSLEQIEIHLSMGSGEKDFKLEEYNISTSTWSLVGTYNYNTASKNAGTDSIYIIPISRTSSTKFRIANNTSSSMYLWKVITRTTNPPSLPIPVVGATTGISPTSFTANWTWVPNATGYYVYVYEGTSSIAGSPFTVSSKATESLIITDLTAATAYTYHVQAKGNMMGLNSFMSPATSVTTTISTGFDNSKTSNLITASGKNIFASEVGTFEVFNLQGAQVLRLENVKNINTNLNNGLYIVRFSNAAGKQFNQKITIK